MNIQKKIEYLFEYSTFWIFILWKKNIQKCLEYSWYLWIFMIFKWVRSPDGACRPPRLPTSGPAVCRSCRPPLLPSAAPAVRRACRPPHLPTSGPADHDGKVSDPSAARDMYVVSSGTSGCKSSSSDTTVRHAVRGRDMECLYDLLLMAINGY